MRNTQKEKIKKRETEENVSYRFDRKYKLVSYTKNHRFAGSNISALIFTRSASMFVISCAFNQKANTSNTHFGYLKISIQL